MQCAVHFPESRPAEFVVHLSYPSVPVTFYPTENRRRAILFAGSRLDRRLQCISGDYCHGFSTILDL